MTVCPNCGKSKPEWMVHDRYIPAQKRCLRLLDSRYVGVQKPHLKEYVTEQEIEELRHANTR